jgi:hypothetical protein
MASMAVAERFDHLRHAALDLLDAGNSTASVAQLLAVPVQVVTRWRDEPVPPRLEPAAMLAATGAQGRAIGFRTTLVVSEAMSRRLWHYLFAVYVAGSFAVGAADWWRDPWTAWSHHRMFLCNAAIIIGFVLWLRRLSQPLVRLEASAIVVPGWLGATRLAYADLADWWLVMHVKHEGTDDEVEGRLLTLHSRRAGVAPASVFIPDDVTLDPAVSERLAQVKQANQGPRPLMPLGSARTA